MFVITCYVTTGERDTKFRCPFDLDGTPDGVRFLVHDTTVSHLVRLLVFKHFRFIIVVLGLPF